MTSDEEMIAEAEKLAVNLDEDYEDEAKVVRALIEIAKRDQLYDYMLDVAKANGFDSLTDAIARAKRPAPEAGEWPTDDGLSGDAWKAGRDAFETYARRYEEAKSHQNQVAIADVAPAQIYKAMHAALTETEHGQ